MSEPARQTFPVKVLLGRLEQGSTAPWSSYLPDHLRPKGVTPKVFEASTSASSKAKAEVKPPKKEYSPMGISVLGRVWEYSQDAAGCREVQHAIEVADEDIQLRIAAELQDHVTWLQVFKALKSHVIFNSLVFKISLSKVWDAACCPHANHVLQKCILVSQLNLTRLSHLRGHSTLFCKHKPLLVFFEVLSHHPGDAS